MGAHLLRLAPPPADAALIAAARAGDEQAHAQLYRRHAPHIARLVHRVLGRDGDLDDIVQETFVVGFRQLDRLDDADRLRPYLVTIAMRRVSARLSWRYRARALAASVLGTSACVSDPDLVAPVSDAHRLLDGVDVRHRMAWILHRVEGCTLPDVAGHTGASLATVKRWIARVDAVLEGDDGSR